MKIDSHPFAARPNNCECNSCGRSRVHVIHATISWQDKELMTDGVVVIKHSDDIVAYDITGKVSPEQLRSDAAYLNYVAEKIESEVREELVTELIEIEAERIRLNQKERMILQNRSLNQA